MAQIDGTDGNDRLNGTNRSDTIVGMGGDDTIEGRNSNDRLFGDDGNDTISGGNGEDLIEGGDGDDDLSGDQGQDTIRGGDGDDEIDGGRGDDRLFGEDGNDSIEGGQGQDRLDGGDGDDRLSGGQGDDKLRGQSGDDVLFGGQGQDRLFGNDGDDLLAGDQGDDLLDGGDGDDLLDGGGNNDRLFGGSGNDELSGGDGQDQMFGGDDRDTFSQGGAQSSNGDFIDGGTGGDDFDTLDLRDTGPFRLTNLRLDADGDSQSGRVELLGENGNVIGGFEFREIEKIVPCFTSGTMIATPRGEVAIESLREGDKVITRDNGMQEIRWIGQKLVDVAMMTEMPQLCPVRVCAGALGNGLPERDLYLSPNHRVLLMEDRVNILFEDNEVLSAVKHLDGRDGISRCAPAPIRYWHILFDRHEVILSNGAWSESFQPGDYALQGIDTAQRAEVLALFPHLANQSGIAGFDAARLTLKRYEAELLRG